MLMLLGLLLTGQAHSLNLTGHRFTDSYRYSLLEDAYLEKFSGNHVLTGSYGYVHTPFYYTDEDVDQVDDEIIKYNHALTLGFTHYQTGRFTWGLDAGAVNNKVLDKTYTSFNDLNLRAKYRLWENGANAGFALNPFIGVPTGRQKNFTTARGGVFGLQGVGEKHWTAWHLLGSLGYSHSPRNNYEIVDYRNLLLAQLGVSLDLSSVWNLNFETVRNWTLSGDERQDEGDYFLTAKNKTWSTISTYFGAGIAGTERVERSNYTLFAGLKWSEAAAAAGPLAAAPQAPAPKPVEKPRSRAEESSYGKMVKLENVYFGNNRSDVGPAERAKVMKAIIAALALKDDLVKVVVEGFASTRGDHQKNFVLGQDRSQNVAAMLAQQGIPAGKIVTVSYGDASPQDKLEWKNRKVQFRIYRR